jgi:hypothetical protein
MNMNMLEEWADIAYTLIKAYNRIVRIRHIAKVRIAKSRA